MDEEYKTLAIYICATFLTFTVQSNDRALLDVTVQWLQDDWQLFDDDMSLDEIISDDGHTATATYVKDPDFYDDTLRRIVVDILTQTLTDGPKKCRVNISSERE